MGMQERLEKAGILKHKVTSEELDQANLRSRVLTVQYMHGEIDVEQYQSELDKLPKIDLVELVRELHYKG